MDVFSVQFTIFDARTHEKSGSWFLSSCKCPSMSSLSRVVHKPFHVRTYTLGRGSRLSMSRGRARLLLLNACAPEHTRRHTTCFDHLAGRKRAESVLHMRRHVLAGRSFAVCTTTTGNCTCSFDSCSCILSARMGECLKRERDSVFRERGKKVSRIKLNMRRRMLGVIGEFLILLFLNILYQWM